MTTVWMTPQARARLEAELAELLSQREPGAGADRDETVIATWLANKNRIREIYELLSNAVSDRIPPDDGVAEPGMVVTVRYDDGEQETFLIGVRGAEDAGIEVYSPNSPLGGALLGATPGERRTYRTPTGAQQSVTLLSAAPLSMHLSRS